jgi:hypothetical protein
MAKTVAEIDGDSSGLVKELDQAKQAMVDLGGQGKKLTDQLRDVADQADVAAGALVNKIGGPTAIKAIAGIGGAFVVAEGALAAFSSSMAAYASTQGAAGQQAMKDLDEALNELQGQLFTAVMGTDDMTEAMDTVVTVIKAATIVVEALLSPIRLVAEGIRTMGENSDGATTEMQELSKAQRDAKIATDATATALNTLNDRYKSIEGQLISLLGTQKEYALFELKAISDKILGYVKEEEAMQHRRLMIRGDLAADQAEAITRAKLKADYDEAERKALSLRSDLVHDAAQRELKIYQEKAAVQIPAARDLARQTAVAQMVEEEKGNNERLDLARKGLQEYEKQRQDIISGKTQLGENKPKTGGGGTKDKAETPEEAMARLIAAAQVAVDAAIAENEAIAALKLSNDELEKENELARMNWDDQQRDAKYEKEKAALEGQIAFGQQMLDDAAAERKAKGILTAEEEDALYQERLSKALTYVQDLAGQEMGIYMQNTAKQLALGKLSAKAASDMARSAIGNMIIGQGDKAMAEAGIMAASLNPLAIPMAAAGLAAYAIGNAMMPTAKPNAGSTPATEKAESAQAAGNNYSFNMRVDSVFADGESMARQFAMMQESARARGLLMQGA